MERREEDEWPEMKLEDDREKPRENEERTPGALEAVVAGVLEGADGACTVGAVRRQEEGREGKAGEPRRWTVKMGRHTKHLERRG